ncbi:helix-turn-helix domain-containing protein [Streptomyces malaysiensis subsp. malaysiensis]|uniref:helix-turn-helix domain-containing protein n=1 Tax=Streptomyces malaysiensis TaxID=92644 RepID=UPI0024BF50B9|nr:helix-turn-helix domain-containing protein [Streptomyces sp. NA07423]WHX19808.1 helix-turn-helix domain-containing protein [Streptomyces sp. NA07423]
MTVPADDRATRRASVGQLAHQGLSTRAIARRLGVGKDTVRRDLAHLARANGEGVSASRATDAPPGASTATDRPIDTDPDALVLPGADPRVVALARAARDLAHSDRAGLAHPAHVQVTYLLIALNHVADLLAELYPVGAHSRIAAWAEESELRDIIGRLSGLTAHSPYGQRPVPSPPGPGGETTTEPRTEGEDHDRA